MTTATFKYLSLFKEVTVQRYWLTRNYAINWKVGIYVFDHFWFFRRTLRLAAAIVSGAIAVATGTRKRSNLEPACCGEGRPRPLMATSVEVA